MKTNIQKITTKDGLILHGVIYTPDTPTDTVLVHVHGMAGNFYENAFLDSMARSLTDKGVSFCAFNNRGNGNITEINKKEGGTIFIGASKDTFEDCVLDIQACVDRVVEEGYTKIHLSGHSLGAPKAAYYAAQHGDQLESLILMSPSDMLGLVREKEEEFTRHINTAKEMIERGEGDSILPEYIWGEYPMTANAYIDMFGDDSKSAIFNFHNQELGFETLNKIQIPVLAFMGRKDDVLVVPIEEVMEVLEREVVNMETKVIGDANHCYVGYEDEVGEVVGEWCGKL